MKYAKYISAFIIGSLFFGGVAYAAGVFQPVQGGTGISSATAGQVNNCLKVLTNSPFAYILGTCGSGSGGSFPFTPTSYGNSTSTTIGFTNGIISVGSTTISGLASGFIGNVNGNLYGSATSTETCSSGTGISCTGFDVLKNGGSISLSSIPNSSLTNSSIIINGTTFNLGDTHTITAASSTLLGDTNTWSGTDTFNNTIGGSINGNANTATTLQNARTINGVSFNGSANITINAASSTLLGDTNLFSHLNTFTGGILDNSASSTINGNATTTGTFYATIASSTSLYGAFLATCNSASSALTWSGGQFGCNTISSSVAGGSQGQLQYNATGNTFAGVATSSASCSGFISCSGFTVVGTVSPTITTTGTLSLSSGGTAASLSGANDVIFMNSANNALATNNNFDFLNGQTVLGIGTTTPIDALTVASTTGPQIALSDGQGSLLWTFRNINGNLYLATSTYTGTSTPAAFTITASGQVSALELAAPNSTQSGCPSAATSTNMVIDWNCTPNQIDLQVGAAAFTIGFNNASTSGMTKRILVCNPNSTAGAITWATTNGIIWSNDTTPTQTTTAKKCDIYSFIVTQATSTSYTSTKILGAQTATF